MLFFILNASGQTIIDSCYNSTAPNTNFFSSSTLANYSQGFSGHANADLLEWNGTNWTGSWATANISILPPVGSRIGSRAIFIGGEGWTTGGEGFYLLLNSPLIDGQTYSFDITYVSHGMGSNGNFAPYLYTSSDTGSLSLAFQVGSLTPVGTNWATNTFSFTATSAQDGHTWILIHTIAKNGIPTGSGLVYQFGSCRNNIIGISKLSNNNKKELVKIIDYMGRETEFKPNTPLIFIYSDGTNERVMQIGE